VRLRPGASPRINLKGTMSRLLKLGLWIFILSVVVFALSMNGVSGPRTETGTYIAEAAMIAAPIGLLLCLVAGVRAFIGRPTNS
jgi:hypothetical protein